MQNGLPFFLSPTETAYGSGNVLGRTRRIPVERQVTIETTGQQFEETAKWIDEERSNKAGFPLKSKAAIILKIEEIYAIAPGSGAGKKLA